MLPDDGAGSPGSNWAHTEKSRARPQARTGSALALVEVLSGSWTCHTAWSAAKARFRSTAGQACPSIARRTATIWSACERVSPLLMIMPSRQIEQVPS